jgi:DNA-binding HxlR family transcriptional regulator
MVYSSKLDISDTGRVSRVVELLQGKWTIQILCAMREHPVRLSELKRANPSASKKALTARLRSLEAARVVLRRDLSSSVLHVEYELADTMREPLVALLDHLGEWGKLYDSEGLSTVLLTPFDDQIRMS